MVPQQFDPYHKWLGIPPDEQPCHYYRLLGLQLFESDPEVISNAADRQMLHVRSFQTGKNSAVTQKILNEIAAVRVCLLDANRKRIYDDQLRRKTGLTSQVVAPPPLPSATPLPPLPPPPQHEAPAFDAFDFSTTYTAKKRERKKPSAAPWLAAGVVAALLLGGFLAVAVNRNGGVGESKRRVASKPTAASESQEPSQPKLQPRSKPNSNPEPKPIQSRKERRQVQSASSVKIKQELGSFPPSEDEENNTIPEDEEDTNAFAQPMPWTPDLEGRAKLPVPDAAEQEKALKNVRGIYKSQYNEPGVLARKLIQVARETQNPTDRFVLLHEATTLGYIAFDVRLVFDTIDAAASEYDIRASQAKSKVLSKCFDELSIPSKKARLSAKEKQLLADSAIEVIEQASDEEDFDTAAELGRHAYKWAYATADKEFIQKIVAANKETAKAAKDFADTREAIAGLNDNPDDPDANLTVGKYLCFRKGDWDKGLSMLIKGSDRKLKELAEKDGKGAASAEEQITLGDAWWNAGCKQRAAFWYGKALPRLTGLEKEKVGKRMSEAFHKNDASRNSNRIRRRR